MKQAIQQRNSTEHGRVFFNKLREMVNHQPGNNYSELRHSSQRKVICLNPHVRKSITWQKVFKKLLNK